MEAAIERGLEGIGISSHSPVPFDTYYALRIERLAEYRAEVLRLREVYAGRINVWLGLEVDYIPECMDFFHEQVLPLGFDYLIGSVHYVEREPGGDFWPIDESSERFEAGLANQWKGDAKRMVNAYYALLRQMVSSMHVDVIGHMDRIKKWNDDSRFFDECAPWYVTAVEQTLRAFASAGVIVELNTAYGKRPIDQCYPSPWVLRRCVELGIPLTISSDAHTPNQIAGLFNEAAALLHEVGCREVMALEAGGRWVARRLGKKDTG